MSGPSIRPSVYHSHSWSHPSPACAHTRYCPLQPLRPSLCAASVSVWRPAPCSCVLGTLGGLREPRGVLGQSEPHSGPRAPSVSTATCYQHARPPAAHHVASCPALGQMEHSEACGRTRLWFGLLMAPPHGHKAQSPSPAGMRGQQDTSLLPQTPSLLGSCSLHRQSSHPWPVLVRGLEPHHPPAAAQCLESQLFCFLMEIHI